MKKSLKFYYIKIKPFLFQARKKISSYKLELFKNTKVYYISYI